MTDIIKVNTTRLGNDADKVYQSIKRMQQSITRMQTHVTSLDKAWDGPSSDAFKKAFRDDIKTMNEIMNNLEKLCKYEKNAKSKYEACERKVSSIISNI